MQTKTKQYRELIEYYITNLDDEQVQRVDAALSAVAAGAMALWMLRKGIQVALGVDKKTARRLAWGIEGAAYLTGYQFTKGRLMAIKTTEGL